MESEDSHGTVAETMSCGNKNSPEGFSPLQIEKGGSGELFLQFWKPCFFNCDLAGLAGSNDPMLETM
jgi:hypothetical protein